MSNYNNNLFKLINSLSGSEKRYFSIYASRHTMGAQNNSVRMFKKLEALKKYDEKKFLKKNKQEGFAKHYRFNKHFLYKLILQSLHAFHAGKTGEAEVREQLHYIDILTEKGLFDQAKEIIISAKEKAKKYQFYELLLELLRKELIVYREQSFFGISEETIENILNELNETLADIHSVLKEETTSIRIAQRLMTGGFIRNKKALDELVGLHISNKQKKVPPQFVAAWHFYIARVAIYFMKKDYKNALKETDLIIELVEKHPHMIKEIPKSYISVLHNKIVLMNNLYRYKEVPAVAKKIESVPVRTQILKNRRFFSANNLLLSMYPKTGEFDKGLELLKKMEHELKSGEVQFINPQDRITHSFSAGCINFGIGNFAAANKYLQEIIDGNELSPRADIVAFARILRMLVQFEMQKQDLLEYTVRSVYRFLYKRNRIYKFEDSVLRFIRKKAPTINSPKEMIAAFKELHAELLPLTKDPYEKNAFAYFDIISWLESKIHGKSFAAIVKEKADMF